MDINYKEGNHTWRKLHHQNNIKTFSSPLSSLNINLLSFWCSTNLTTKNNWTNMKPTARWQRRLCKRNYIYYAKGELFIPSTSLLATIPIPGFWFLFCCSEIMGNVESHRMWGPHPAQSYSLKTLNSLALMFGLSANTQLNSRLCSRSWS